MGAAHRPGEACGDRTIAGIHPRFAQAAILPPSDQSPLAPMQEGAIATPRTIDASSLSLAGIHDINISSATG